MMNREPIRNRAVNAFATRQIQYRPPLTRVFAKAVSYLAAYVDNNGESLVRTQTGHWNVVRLISI